LLIIHKVVCYTSTILPKTTPTLCGHAHLIPHSFGGDNQPQLIPYVGTYTLYYTPLEAIVNQKSRPKSILLPIPFAGYPPLVLPNNNSRPQVLGALSPPPLYRLGLVDCYLQNGKQFDRFPQSFRRAPRFGGRRFVDGSLYEILGKRAQGLCRLTFTTRSTLNSRTALPGWFSTVYAETQSVLHGDAVPADAHHVVDFTADYSKTQMITVFT